MKTSLKLACALILVCVNQTLGQIYTDEVQVVEGLEGKVGIGTDLPGAKLDINDGSILLDANQYIYGHQTSGNRGFLKLYDGSTGNVEMGTTFAAGSISFQTNGYERMKLKSDGTVEVPQLSLLSHYHGNRVFVFPANATHSIDLVASFPSVALVNGNGWAVFVKYCGMGTSGTIESREFNISRDSAGNWNSAAFSGTSNDTANLATVSGSGNSIVIFTTAGTYVTAEVTVMIR